jgi:crotonobetainyl-CoA:carnitine CoA-transferase CaiB-like acyl-CoA transferase
MGHSGVDGPLRGVRVVDVSDTFMAPYASLLLAQMGAEVIKVEPPSGDITRQIGDASGTGCGPMFLSINRGKLSVVLDLHVEEDYQRLLALVEHCDVFLHNRRPSTAARLRIDYPTLGRLNARLVYCATVGYGSDGPYSSRAAYDDVIQAGSGIAAVQTGSGEPAYVRTVIADKVAGLFAFGCICAALVERSTSGVGQAVEVPMFETMISFMSIEQMGGLVFDPPKGPSGYVRTNSPYRRPHRTADGLIGVTVYTDGQWRRFFELVGRADLISDERFSTIRSRTDNIDQLYAIVDTELKRRTTADWLEAFEQREIPASRVNSIDDLLSDEHVVATQLFEYQLHPTAGRVRTSRLPARFSRTPPGPVPPAPGLGQHEAVVFGAESGA